MFRMVDLEDHQAEVLVALVRHALDHLGVGCQAGDGFGRLYGL